MKTTSILIIILTCIVATGCGSTDTKAPESAKTNSSISLPQWVQNPVIENGIAETACVKYSGNMSIDQKMVNASARLKLSQQIETRVEGLDKLYASQVSSNNDVTTGTNFSSVSKQLTQQKLTGSRIVKTDIIDIAGVNNLCSMMTMDPLATKELFDAIISQSQRIVDPQDQKFLYQEFKSAKAEENLDAAIKKLIN
jgi:hypothetical protein